MISTFCSSQEHIELAIQSGAERLILEDSKVCVRSFYNDFERADFQKLVLLAQYARHLAPQIELAANLDLLIHHRHYELIETWAKSIKSAGITLIRVQDPGAIGILKPLLPDATFQLAMETANQNLSSIAAWSTYFPYQCLNNELPESEISKVRAHFPALNFEIQVQGPLLIQYSNRRFMTGLENKFSEADAPPLTRISQDTEYLGRKYPFYDTPHGHMMYLHFDRCLAPYLPKLSALNLNSWLIDARGESMTYFRSALQLYKQEAENYLQNPDSWHINHSLFSNLQAAAQRPQRPGFFLANRTDQDRKSVHDTSKFNHELGTVVDCIKPNWITIETKVKTCSAREIVALTPEGKTIELAPFIPYTLQNQAVNPSELPPFIRLKWHKGITPQTRLFW